MERRLSYRARHCPRANGGQAAPRNEILRATRHLARALWKQYAGDHVRSRVEAQMPCLKLFDERIMSRDPDRQTAEIQIRIIRHCRSDQ